jgi:hypothetical protein
VEAVARGDAAVVRNLRCLLRQRSDEDVAAAAAAAATAATSAAADTVTTDGGDVDAFSPTTLSTASLLANVGRSVFVAAQKAKAHSMLNLVLKPPVSVNGGDVVGGGDVEEGGAGGGKKKGGKGKKAKKQKVKRRRFIAAEYASLYGDDDA